MFTGIIEELGKVYKTNFTNGSESSLDISAKKVLEQTRIGDSICVNGVCLTVTNISDDKFRADVMPETLNRSNLGDLKVGDSVDLERALAANGRFGGHIVSGHIDGTGEIIDIRNEGNAMWFVIKTNPTILKYIVEKGSIAIDGISLTVANVKNDTFSVSIIPHTLDKTILMSKEVGDKVNLENDIVGKYIERFLNFKTPEENESKITMDFLLKQGF